MKRSILFGLLICSRAFAFDFDVEVDVEWRFFLENALEGQSDNHGSFYVEPEFYYDVNEQSSITAKYFYRYDLEDANRTHGDIRELYWTYVKDDLEVQLGYGKVFWGVTESRHLVDIINQTDLVENLDEEDKLGQPMLSLAYTTDQGTFSGYLLPYFRERTFPGTKGRLRTTPRVNEDLVIYESERQKKHIDWALRWSHAVDIWDIGLSVFRGTSREPILIPTSIALEPYFAPFYEIITQYSADIQATTGNWLLKYEGLHRRGLNESYTAMIPGFEYTFYGLFDTSSDLGVIAEYHYDSRHGRATTPFNRDLALGFRWTPNDAASTELLAFVLLDMEWSSKLWRVEASRRLGENATISLEASFFSNINTMDPLFLLRQDDYVQVNMTYFF